MGGPGGAGPVRQASALLCVLVLLAAVRSSGAADVAASSSSSTADYGGRPGGYGEAVDGPLGAYGAYGAAGAASEQPWQAAAAAPPRRRLLLEDFVAAAAAGGDDVIVPPAAPLLGSSSAANQQQQVAAGAGEYGADGAVGGYYGGMAGFFPGAYFDYKTGTTYGTYGAGSLEALVPTEGPAAAPPAAPANPVRRLLARFSRRLHMARATAAV